MTPSEAFYAGLVLIYPNRTYPYLPNIRYTFWLDSREECLKTLRTIPFCKVVDYDTRSMCRFWNNY